MCCMCATCHLCVCVCMCVCVSLGAMDPHSLCKIQRKPRDCNIQLIPSGIVESLGICSKGLG